MRKLRLVRGLLPLVYILVCALPIHHAVAQASPPLNVGSHWQPFLDEWLIDKMQNTTLRMHPPTRQEVVFVFDAPWEGVESAYVGMMKDGDRFRMYYRGGGETTQEVTCLAESDDGINWTRPKLGLYEFNGSKENNIIWMGRKRAYWESHNFMAFKDGNPAAKPEEKYKAVALGRYPDESGDNKRMLVALVSPDGIRWQRLREDPIIRKGSFDSQNVAFWDSAKQEYVCYFREGRDGKRSVRRCASKDFINWTESEWLDFGDTPLEHFYTCAIAPYFRNPGLYLGFPMRFVPERQKVGAEGRRVDALSDGVMISSHDGTRFYRQFMEAFIRPGPDRSNWGSGHGNNTPAWGLLDTSPREISIYWCENYGVDWIDRKARVRAGQVPQLRRGTLRTDGFASVNAPYDGGEFVTKPLRFAGKKLVLNYATSAVGSVRVEVQDADGKPVAGFETEDCAEIYGDELERVVVWKNSSDLGGLAGKPIRLRFSLKDADLYSICFKP